SMGSKVGEWRWYDEAGLVSTVGYFDTQGRMTGTWTQHDASGEAFNAFEMCHGTGHERRLYPDGALAYDVEWVDGKREGDAISYFPNGQRKLEETYVDGVLSGVAREFTADGV